MSTFCCPEKTFYIKDLLTRLFSLLATTHYGSYRNVSRPVASEGKVSCINTFASILLSGMDPNEIPIPLNKKQVFLGLSPSSQRPSRI